jgi:glycosyltransferase involved in cell wall biosynthesis
MLRQPLRILQVSTADIGGGAEKMAWNLFHCYRTRGLGSWLAVGTKRSDDPGVLMLPRLERNDFWSRLWLNLEKNLQGLETNNTRLISRTRTALRTLAHPRRELGYRLGLEDFDWPGTKQLLGLIQEKPDVIHCHNLHGGYFDLRLIPWLSQHVPLILTVHDAWLLSGHCAHSLECERWKTGCGECPHLDTYPAIARDATAYNWQRKRKIYRKSRVYVTTPSRWLMRKIEQSILAPAVVESRVIPNAIDLSIFHPAEKQADRAALGLPSETKVLLFTANGIRRNVWKDYSTMQAAVAEVAEGRRGKSLIFLALGEKAPPERIGQAEVRFVPYQKDPQVVARYYRAADLYIHAARAEAWGLTITEALACGTPVVATAVGGIPEQIKPLDISDCGQGNYGFETYGRDQATGILVPPGDARSMALGIKRLLKEKSLRHRMGENAARDAVKRFDLERQADGFVRWYREILIGWRPTEVRRVWRTFSVPLRA